MQRTAVNMVLLLAIVLTLPACGVFRPCVAGYQLDTELPQGLPSQAPIYHVVESPTPAVEWAHKVAVAMGFEGDPVSYSEAAAQPEWTWAGPLYSAEYVTVHGNIAFQGSPLDADSGAGTLETAEESVAAARAWLTTRDLLPADCAQEACAWAYQTGPVESKLTHYGWNVCFRRHLDALPVGSCSFPGSSCVFLRLDTLGYITQVSYRRREVQIESQVSIKTAREAWRELQRRGPSFFHFEGPMVPEYGTFTITEVSLGYSEGPVGTEEVQKQFKPHYVFVGKAEIPNEGSEVRAAAYVPAWK